MRDRRLGKITLKCGGKMGLGCGEEQNDKEIFPRISNNIIFLFFFCFFEKPVNVVIDMEVGEGNLSKKKKK